MKITNKIRTLALVLCMALLFSCLPLTALAGSANEAMEMVEGDVIAGFAPAGSSCSSTDSSIAWVDENGNLNAMKPGSADVTVPDGTYTVNVSDYSDGSNIVGNLKLLARYNDSMQFYDGHVYLLFTSYQDGVTVCVPDLYAGYEIDESYYDDIREDIAYGSNHTGSDAEKYFTFNDDMNSVTLDRGELVTIGMYRDFDMSVFDAALGSLQNSTVWAGIETSVKDQLVRILFELLENHTLPEFEAVDKIKALLQEAGVDYNKLLDGVVSGGVCFNRELYNQKLEWDQYENVTYEMDITQDQLNTLQAYLSGNLDKFSILKNSCATVALRAWNAAVGTRDGEDTAYKLSYTGSGIFSVIDAPKSVRDSIVGRLPGYYLNNAEGVAEPGAGYEDETGWVYVSAPEDVAPLTLTYDDGYLFFDQKKTKIATLINAAKGDADVSYNKDEQDVEVTFDKSVDNGLTTVNGAQFDINGSKFTLNADNMPSGGIWYTVPVRDAAEGEDYYVLDGDGNYLDCEYSDGVVSFRSDALPFSYRVTAASAGAQDILRTVIVKDKKADVETRVYTMNGEDKDILDPVATVAAGTRIYVKTSSAYSDSYYVITDVTMNGESILDNYDPEQGAYFTDMPDSYSKLTIIYDKAELVAVDEKIAQISVGDTLKATDYAKLLIGDDAVESDKVAWQIISGDGSVIPDGRDMKAVKTGETILWAYAEGNENIGIVIRVKVYDSVEDLAAVTFNEDDINVYSTYGGEEELVMYSGYRVKQGVELTLAPIPAEGEAVLSLTVNGEKAAPGEKITVTGDTDIAVSFAKAKIDGVPEEIKLKKKGDTYQLNAKVKYTDLLKLLVPVYDSSIEYISSDELVTVDENGLITLAGDVPEDGAAVYVTAKAGSANTVRANIKVVVGDYTGDDIAGRMTISSRWISKQEPMPHGCFTLTSYEDVDMPVSYYNYFKPNEKFDALMTDYEQNPGNYSSDPALYNDNDLGLSDRESYFEQIHHGAMSEPSMVSLKAGESVTISNYGYDSTNLVAVMKAIEDSDIASSKDTQALVEQMRRYTQGEEIDSVLAFDSTLATIKQIYAITKATGSSPANGHSSGGMDINKEIFNQFRRNDTQLPNNYYTVEITKDEFAMLQTYLADPSNNHYSFMAKNCATGVVDMWNTALYDKPELHLTANITGLAAEPVSLFFDLARLQIKDVIYDYDGNGGFNFYPRTVRFSDATKDVIDKIKAIDKAEAGSKEQIALTVQARKAYNALNTSEKDRVWNYSVLADAEKALHIGSCIIGDADGSGTVDAVDACCMQRFIAGIRIQYARSEIMRADVDGSGELSIYDVTVIQFWLSGMKTPYPIGEKN